MSFKQFLIENEEKKVDVDDVYEYAISVADKFIENFRKFDKKEMSKFTIYSWPDKSGSPTNTSLSIDKYDTFIIINFNEKKIVSSESLSDRSLNYENTSARRVTFKKTKIQKEASSRKEVDKIFKLIEKKLV